MKRHLVWITAALGIVLTVALLGLWRSDRRLLSWSSTSSDTKTGVGNSFGVLVPRLQVSPDTVAGTLPQFNPVAVPVMWELARVATVMKEWQAAIVNKNAETVERVDDLFRASPEAFGPELELSARNDPEPRVRAFSTRVLGNTRRVDAIPTLRACLKDTSEYVRGNAAWALGELHDLPSLPVLTRIATRDPSAGVRDMAKAAIQKLSDLASPKHSP